MKPQWPKLSIGKPLDKENPLVYTSTSGLTFLHVQGFCDFTRISSCLASPSVVVSRFVRYTERASNPFGKIERVYSFLSFNLHRQTFEGSRRIRVKSSHQLLWKFYSERLADILRKLHTVNCVAVCQSVYCFLLRHVYHLLSKSVLLSYYNTIIAFWHELTFEHGLNPHRQHWTYNSISTFFVRNEVFA